MSSSVRWVACTAVVARAEGSRLGEQLGRREPGRGQAGVVLGDLLGEVHVQRLPGGRLDHDLQLLARDRAHRVDRRADPLVVERGDALGPGVRVAVGVADLHSLRRPVEAGGQVAGVEQPDPDPGLVGRRQQRPAHLVGVVVRRAVGLVVQVVELADRGDAGVAHLGVGVARQREVGVRGEVGGHGVHLLAPGPERAPLLLGVPRGAPGGRRGCGSSRGRAGSAPGGRPARSPTTTDVITPSSTSRRTSSATPSGSRACCEPKGRHPTSSSRTVASASTPARQSAV